MFKFLKFNLNIIPVCTKTSDSTFTELFKIHKIIYNIGEPAQNIGKLINLFFVVPRYPKKEFS